jgi:hypothetical protein
MLTGKKNVSLRAGITFTYITRQVMLIPNTLQAISTATSSWVFTMLLFESRILNHTPGIMAASIRNHISNPIEKFHCSSAKLTRPQVPITAPHKIALAPLSW